MIYLKDIFFRKENVNNWEIYPFSLPIIKNLGNLSLEKDVTFFVGENGSGKSTLLESIAKSIGFDEKGGGKNHCSLLDQYQLYQSTSLDAKVSTLDKYIEFSWKLKTYKGFFFRSETFFNFASLVNKLELEDPNRGYIESYGGKSLHSLSHGESFFTLFHKRFKEGIFLLDEPESALSPSNQFAFLRKLFESKKCQFIIATHSPILLSYPHAKILEFSHDGLKETIYKDTELFKTYHSFLNSSDTYLKHLLSE